LQDKYQYYTCADITKLRNAGFTAPMTPLPDTVRDYVLNYLIPDRYLGDEPSEPRVKRHGTAQKEPRSRA